VQIEGSHDQIYSEQICHVIDPLSAKSGKENLPIGGASLQDCIEEA
jgi:hypothetical protein